MSESSSRDDGAEFDYYLPGMPSLSPEQGPVEWFLKRLFRRRGSLEVVRRPER
jgi:hypothetical protein